jgi:hypothetical protein
MSNFVLYEMIHFLRETQLVRALDFSRKTIEMEDTRINLASAVAIIQVSICMLQFYCCLGRFGSILQYFILYIQSLSIPVSDG